jgi:PAS domain S-box-containing protein
MSRTEFQFQAICDPRLAVHATSAQPVWLWSADGTHVLWANPVGARLLGAANSTEIARKTFGPADAHRRQVAQLANRLPLSGVTRLERLRGFGARPGMLMTCGCARLDFPDGSHGVLINAVETTVRSMPLAERLQLLADGLEKPISIFDRDGALVAASDAAASLLDLFSQADLEQAHGDALANGHVELPISIGNVVLQRVGSGADVGVVVLIIPHAVEAEVEMTPAQDAPEEDAPPEDAPQEVAPPAEMPIPAYEQPALTNEAPAEFALIDEFAEPPEMEPSTPGPASTENNVTSDKTTAEPEKPRDEKPQDDKKQGAPPAARRHPLRFAWQMDADGHFSLGSDEFSWLIGARTAAGFGRPWDEIAQSFGLDPADRLREAIATRETWSGVTLYWPVDGGGRLPVELSGLPVFGENREYAGYRGVGVCRDLDSLEHLAMQRRLDPAGEAARSLAGDIVPDDSERADPAHESPGPSATIANGISSPTDLDEPVETPQNVVPFRPIGESRSLSPVENHAFNELARQLSARLDRDTSASPEAIVTSGPIAPAADPAAAEPPREQAPAPEWLAPPEPPARGETRRDRALLDLLPSGILIYRLDRLLYANPAFLRRVGYDSLHALEQAGGLDALYVEPGVSTASSTSEAGTPMTISASADSPATEARLFTISWDGESALALMFAPAQAALDAVLAPPPSVQAPESVISAPAPAEVGQAAAEDLAAILDTTAEGIVMFDAAGHIHACNRSAEALFGYGGEAFLKHNLTDLFAPESLRAVGEYVEGIKSAGVASLLDHGREVLGRVARGGIIPLSMTIGRTRPDGPNFFAVFRDLSQSRKGENELQQARRLADGAASAKADMLARISHELRTPLNAIIGFTDVMIAERFGALGNERYVEYMKDIRASGQRVTAIIDDLTELSRIETGKLELAFTNQNLNEMVESCVAMMQPQANRERIIIRTSLAQSLPPVVADGRALRQITMNLIGNSIHLANPAGQVIVSTALSDFGEVVLRVRDTGPGLNDNEVAAALEPFRTSPPSDQSSDNASGVNLSLTKALVEANRAQFNLKSAAHTGTLVEVVFSRAMARG